MKRPRRSTVAILSAVGVIGVLPLVIGSWLLASTKTYPPHAITNVADPAQRSAVLDYARSLVFDSTRGASDQNLLDTLGTVGILSPEVSNHKTRTSDLAGGRIQLRVRIIPPTKHPAMGYRSFPAGTSYLWVDSLKMSGGTGTARGVIIPEDPSLPTKTIRLSIHPAPFWNRSLARWNEAQGQCWVCERTGWCHS